MSTNRALISNEPKIPIISDTRAEYIQALLFQIRDENDTAEEQSDDFWNLGRNEGACRVVATKIEPSFLYYPDEVIFG